MALEVSFKKANQKLNNMKKVLQPSALSTFVECYRSCCYFCEDKIKELNSILDNVEHSLDENGELFERLFDVMSPNDLLPEQFSVSGYRELEQRLQSLAVKVRSPKKT